MCQNADQLCMWIHLSTSPMYAQCLHRTNIVNMHVVTSSYTPAIKAKEFSKTIQCAFQHTYSITNILFFYSFTSSFSSVIVLVVLTKELELKQTNRHHMINFRKFLGINSSLLRLPYVYIIYYYYLSGSLKQRYRE